MHLRNTITRSSLYCRLTFGSLGILVASFLPASAAEPWNFVSAPDFINGDIVDRSGTLPIAIAAGTSPALGWSPGDPFGTTPTTEASFGAIAAHMATHSPEAMFIAGDLVGGIWNSNTARDRYAPGTTGFETTINNAGDLIYAQWKQRFINHGIDTFYAAVGDHEIGDNDWAVNSEKSQNVGDYKEVFVRNFNQDELGATLFGTPINGAPSRPVGTPFADTSYAVKHNNLVLVSVDVFRQQSSSVEIDGATGTVKADVIDDHLAWLDNVLSAAQSDPSIDHIVVQGHTPALSSVRKIQTSGMMLDGHESSGFWQTLNQYEKVAAYFAGEVHTTTASVDASTNLVQVVHGSPPFATEYNYLSARVFEDRIEFEMFETVPANLGSGTVLTTPISSVGSLVIDKSSGTKEVWGTGRLALLDTTGLLVHYDFDDLSSAAINQGAFNDNGTDYYDGTPTNLSSTAGVLGDAASFDGSSYTKTFAHSPVQDAEDRTVALWVRSTANGEQQLAGWGVGAGTSNGTFDITLQNGVLAVGTDDGRSAEAFQAPVVNDGLWHHLAVVLPGRDNNLMSDLLFYVDGVEYTSSSNTPNEELVTRGRGELYVGDGAQGDGANLIGDMDDFGIWGTALDSGKIRAISTAMLDPATEFDASDMQALFKVFDTGNGTTTIDGTEWGLASGLSGAAGDVLLLPNGDHAIQFDASGFGVRSLVNLTPGDVDGDGDVDLNDFEILRQNLFQNVASFLDGDLTGDGLVDFQDFNTWRAFHSVFLTSASVPEPTGLVLLMSSLAYVSLSTPRPEFAGK